MDTLRNDLRRFFLLAGPDSTRDKAVADLDAATLARFLAPYVENGNGKQRMEARGLLARIA